MLTYHDCLHTPASHPACDRSPKSAIQQPVTTIVFVVTATVTVTVTILYIILLYRESDHRLRCNDMYNAMRARRTLCDTVCAPGRPLILTADSEIL